MINHPFRIERAASSAGYIPVYHGAPETTSPPGMAGFFVCSEFRRELVILVVHHEQAPGFVVDVDRREGQFFIFDTETICLDVASGNFDVGVVEAEVVVKTMRR